MDPVSLTLGAIAAAVVAKASDKAADRAVDAGAGAAGRLVVWMRRRLGADSLDEASTALARVEDVPDSPSLVRELAVMLDRRAEADADFRSELAAQVHEAQAGGVDIGSIAQAAWGHGNVQIGGVVNSAITVTGRDAPPGR